MGLDWNPADRARPGHEREFKRAKAGLEALHDRQPWQQRVLDAAANRFSFGRTSAQIQSDYDAVAITPYETLGAPRVDMDAAATRWARAQYENLEKRTHSLEEHLRRLHGYWVLDLLPPSDGLPVYSNGSLYGGVDRFSFRGQFLNGCELLLGKRLLNEAWDPHEPEALRDYGRRLAEVATQHASKTGTADWLNSREPPDDAAGAAHQTHVLISAAKWCRFWSERQHGLEPWF